MANKKNTLLLSTLLLFGITFSSVTKVQAQATVSGDRIWGANRYETSINISKTGWIETSDIAIIATGRDFPDALSATPLAKKFNAPILLTAPDTLDPQLDEELSRLKVSKAYIIGGTGVISEDLEKQLNEKGIECVRLAGQNRYETSAAVAAELGGTGRAVIATGRDFPDALSIAPWAASAGVPILLTDPGKLPDSVSEYIKNNSITDTYIIGGTGVVSDDVMAELPNPSRIAGNNRYETNLAVLNAFEDQFDLSKLYLATGMDFPDALSGSALASLASAPVILTGNGPIPDTKAYIDSNIDKLGAVYIIGGEGVVPNSAVESIIPPVVTAIEIIVPETSVGMYKQMKAEANITMIPSNAVKPGVTFSVSDSSIASIDENGNITGLAPGVTEIIVETLGKSSALEIRVNLDKLIVLDPGHGGWSPGAVPRAGDGTELLQYKESILNMQVAEKVRQRLEAVGVNVVMTREEDSYISLADRAIVANDLNADMFISIHHDSASASSTGTSAFYSNYKPGVDTDDIYVEAYGSGPVYTADNKLLGNLTKGDIYAYAEEKDGDVYIEFNGNTGKVSLDYIMVYDRTPSVVSLLSKVLAETINRGISSLGLRARGASDRNLAVTRLTNGVSVLLEVGFLSNPDEFERIRQESFQEQVADKIAGAVVEYYKNYPDSPSIPEDDDTPGIPTTP